MTVDKFENIPMRGVLRTLRQRSVFRGREITLESIEQPIDHGQLTVVELHVLEPIPELLFIEHGPQGFPGAVDGASSSWLSTVGNLCCSLGYGRKARYSCRFRVLTKKKRSTAT